MNQTLTRVALLARTTFAATSIVWLLASMPIISPLHAVELSVGHGDFTIDAKLGGIANARFDLPVRTLTLRQPPTRVNGSPMAWSAEATVFTSDFVNRITDMASRPLQSDLPLIGQSIDDAVSRYTAIPVPADYRVHGIDIDLAMAWTLIDDTRIRASVGLNLGLSLPYMETRNMRRDANTIVEWLERTQTRIRSLRLGPVLNLSKPLGHGLSLEAYGLLDRHWGQFDNTRVDGGVEVGGLHDRLDIGLQYRPKRWHDRVRLTMGYRLSQWRYERSTLRLKQATTTLDAPLDLDFTARAFYLGGGFRF